MSGNTFKWLQFFADGGASGGDGGSGGAGTGVTSADAGQSTGAETADAGRKLEDLGVPKDKAEQYRQRMEKRSGRKSPPSAQSPAQDESADRAGKEDGERIAASASPPRNDSSKAAAPDWDTFMQIPENKQKLESMMAARGRSATEERSAAQEQTAKLAPALELLSVRYGIESKDGQYDLDKLIEAITGDDLFFEDKALESGESVDKVKADWKKERETAQRQQQERQQQLQAHFFKMQQQAPALQQEFPNFDLRAELNNPEFVRLTAPDIGWDLRRAYRAVHQDEIEQNLVNGAAKIAKEQAARAQQAGQARPRENGGSSVPVSIGNDYASMREKFAKMTSEERRAYIRAARPPR